MITRSKIQHGLLIFLTASLVSCTHSERIYHESVQKMTAIAKVGAMQDRKIAKRSSSNIPRVVSNALQMPTKLHRKYSSKRFDVTVNEMPIKNFLTYLSSISNQNIIMSPKLEGTVSLHLRHVTLGDVFLVTEDTYGLSVERSAYGYTVKPAAMVTRSYQIAQLSMTREGSSTMSVNDSSGSNNATDTTTATSTATSSATTSTDGNQSSSTITSSFGEANFWEELKTSIEELIGANSESGAGKTVTVNISSGVAIVRAMPKDQLAVADFVRSINAINGRQIVIDAMVLEVSLSNTEKVGLESLTLPGGHLTWTGGSTGTLEYASTKTSTGFGAVMNLLSSVGRVSVLSRPRISTMNNQKALIKVGKDEYYSLGLSNTTSVSTVTTTSAGFSLQSFFSGIALDITPQIESNNEVLLHIHPIISEITSTPYTVKDNSQEYEMQVPLTQVTETDTMVKAKNGQIIIIAGLMREKAKLTDYGLPLSKKRNYSYNKDHTSEKRELFILLRPTIVGDHTWARQLDHVANIYAHSGR